MNLRRTAVILSILSLAWSGCAAQPSTFEETVLPKLRAQCEQGVEKSCEQIAETACLNGTPTTCKEDCWPANVARACAQYRPDYGSRPAGPGGSFFQ